ncbi:MAG TPA: glycosyltransferase [Gemmatimonadales bacterium]|nr:glycosyltransferase [Gemmatimonadales bacterium]
MSRDVVVDARALAYPITGMGRYAAELLRHMTCADGRNWILLVPRPVPAALRATIQGSVQWIEGDVGWGMEAWIQRVARRELKRHAGAVFLGLANSIPFFGPRASRSVLVAYDITYLTAPRLTVPRDLIMSLAVNLPSLVMADRVLPISPFVEQQLARLIPRIRRRTRVLPLGGNNIGPGPTPRAFAARRGFLVVGLHPRKRLDVVLDAYARLSAELRARHPLVIVGRTLSPAERRRIAEPDLRDHVITRLDAPDSELVQLYRHSLAHIYLSAHEGLGLPVAEALSAGLPSIVSAKTPMASFLGGGGIILSEAHAAVAAAVMQRLATDARLWQTCADAAAEIGRSIGWEKLAAAVLEEL